MSYPVITVVYTRKYGKKPIIKTFNNVYHVDKILSTRSKHIPVDSEIIEIGVGDACLELYQKKYGKKQKKR